MGEERRMGMWWVVYWVWVGVARLRDCQGSTLNVPTDGSTLAETFIAPWSFTLNTSADSTCTTLRGNISALCFVATTSSTTTTSSSPPTYVLAIVVSGFVSELLNPQIIWTANRRQPVANGASLRLQTSGNLELSHPNGSFAWSSNTSGLAVSRIRIDSFYSGRLALENSASNATLWSSFDSPTDTVMQNQPLLPYQKLVSNLSSTDASEGPYSLVVEPGGLVMYFNTGLGELLPYWTWGVYGLNDLAHVLHTCNHPAGALFEDYRIVFTYQSDQQSNATSAELCAIDGAGFPDFADYFDTSLLITGGSPNLALSFLRIEADGALRSYYSSGPNWVKDYDPLNDECALPNRCGPYGLCTSPGSCNCPQNSVAGLVFTQNSSGMGCVPLPPLSFPRTCNLSTNSSTQTFLELTGVDYFTNQYLPPDLSAVSDQQCKAACLQNCSCKAAFYHNQSRSCFYASHQLWTMRKTDNQSLMAFIKVEQMPTDLVVSPAPSSSNQTKVVAFSVSAVVLFAVVSIVVGFVWVKSRRNREPLYKEEMDLDTLNFRRFTFKELEDATSGFTSRQLGAGGFGVVYEGHLPEAGVVAIKKLKSQGKKEFRAEVEGMGTINHVNLVHLMGFCAEESHRLLVYEYVPNGSLDTWIFNPEKYLNWDVRLQIAVGTAQCLAYLHEGCRSCILHLDIKPQNILLDEYFCAKVCDFGLCELLDRNQDAVPLIQAGGTYGYIAPEIWSGVGATTKSDVYSFGMVLWELASGQKVLESKSTSDAIFLPARDFPKVEMGRWDEVIDELVYKEVENDEGRLVQVQNTLKLAYWCIQGEPDNRPSMPSVVQQLQSHGQEVPTPPPSPNFTTPNLASYLNSVRSASVLHAISLSTAR